MRLPGRAPREVYRVYGEQEFLAASEVPADARPDPRVATGIAGVSSLEQAPLVGEARSPTAVLALCALAAVAIGVGALVVASALRQPPDARPGAKAPSVPKGVVARSPAPATGGASAWGMAQTTAAAVAGQARRRRPLATAAPRRAERATLGEAHAASASASSAPISPAQASAAPVALPTPPALPPAAQVPAVEAQLALREFGFER